VVVDYLQLMSATLPSAGGKRYENRTQEVSAISRGLKALAKELDVPVLALSQLSRNSERRGDDKRPMLSDLRESGSIEQDADVVAFIHRESYYNRNKEEMSEDEKAKSEIIVAKQRNGPTDTVYLNFVAKFTRFENQDGGTRREECMVMRIPASRLILQGSFKISATRPAMRSLGDSPAPTSIRSTGKTMLWGRRTRRLARKSAYRSLRCAPWRTAYTLGRLGR